MNNEFDVDEIVWAKVSGYPWWPGYVNSKTSDNVYEIVFLSDLSKGILKPSRIRSFTEFKGNKNIKQKDLLKSFEIAN